jgi:hypothetical protein
MIDKTEEKYSNNEGVMLCTYRFFDPEFPEFTRLIVKSKNDNKAMELGRLEIGDVIYDLGVEIIEYRAIN